MAHLEKGARNCREALMKGLLPELTEEELRSRVGSISQTGALTVDSMCRSFLAQ